MSIERELLEQGLGKYVMDYLMEGVDISGIVKDRSTVILGEIQDILKNYGKEEDDFLTVDEIVSVFARYGMDTGGCHDF